MDGEERLVAMAATQHGIFRREQAIERGLSRDQISHRLASGRWTKVYPLVYRVAGAPDTWRQRLKAVSLWAERGFALSHASAAALWQLPGFAEGPLEVTVARGSRPPPGVVVHRVTGLDARDVASFECFRVTGIARTLLDLAAGHPTSVVRAAVDHALTRRRLTLERLEAALRRARGLRGTTFLMALVQRYRGGTDGPTESVLEQRVLELLEHAGLPRARCQRAVRVAGRLRRLDFVIPGTRVVIEADGFAYHTSLASFEADRQRNNALTAAGYVVLHWTWRGLEEEPERLVCELAAVLSSGAAAGRSAR